MGELRYDTPNGAVILEPNGLAAWLVFRARGHKFLGSVELENAEGEYTATVAGGTPQVCASLGEAARIVGSAG